MWRHREHLFDLPSRVQCRCRKESICENGALLWHLHRIYRLDVLRRVGNVGDVRLCAVTGARSLTNVCGTAVFESTPV